MDDYRNFLVEATGALYDCGNRLRRRKMCALLPELKEKIVLEVGFGIGDFWIELNNKRISTGKEYVGLDMSSLNLEEATRIADSLGLLRRTHPLIQGDVLKLPFKDNSFDVLIAAEILEHIDDKAAMGEVSRVLKKGGSALITVPYLGEPVVGWGHLRHYDLDKIKSLAKGSNFDIQKINIFGRFHGITWVKIKRVLYRIYGIWKKFRGIESNYYESCLHRNFIMPLFDRILFLDDRFHSKGSILGDKGYLIALFKKAGT